ncbi:MAG: hypothetical protein AAF270_09325 [Pseudomonadota bacterium]
MSDTNDDKRIRAAVQRDMDDTVSPEIAARLRAAREEAVLVAEKKHRDGGLAWRPLVPLGGVSAAALLAVVLINHSPSTALPVLDDAEMAAAADLELLDELELLAWLDDEVLDAG